jgi:hypothetical protein
MSIRTKLRTKLHALTKHTKSIVALGFAALFIGGVTAAIAQADQTTATTSSSTQECKVFNAAVTTAMQNHMSLVDRFMSSAQKGMDKAMNNSCLSAIQMLNFNLSSLIPDFNIFGKILELAIEKFTQYLTSQVCQAINSVIGDWNNIVSQLTVDWNVNSQIEKWGNDVVMSVPGGSSSLLTPGSSGGGLVNLIDPNQTTGSGSSGSNCIETLAGKSCTDGSLTPPSNGNSGSSSGSGSLDNTGTVNGSQVGAEYERMKASCAEAQSTWLNYIAGDASLTQIENKRLDALSVCKTAQSYYSQYQSYLGSSGTVSINPGLNTPTVPANNSSQANGNTIWNSSTGLAVRQ